MYHYLIVSLNFDNNKEPSDISAVNFKNNIIRGLKKLFGETGSSINFDILKFDKDNLYSIIRCPSNFYVKFRSNLTLLSSFEGYPCTYQVSAVSTQLLSLLSDSRHYIHLKINN